MKIFIIVILSIILSIIFVQSYFIVKERNQLKIDLANLNTQFQALSKENADLQSDIEYFSYPENLEKELRLKFNYKRLDEKMMIIVP